MAIERRTCLRLGFGLPFAHAAGSFAQNAADAAGGQIRTLRAYVSVDKYVMLLPRTRIRLVSFRLDGGIVSETSAAEPASRWQGVRSGELDAGSFALDLDGTVGVELLTNSGHRYKASCGLLPISGQVAYFVVEPISTQVVRTERMMSESAPGTRLTTSEEVLEVLSGIKVRPSRTFPQISSG